MVLSLVRSLKPYFDPNTFEVYEESGKWREWLVLACYTAVTVETHGCLVRKGNEGTKWMINMISP